MDEVFYACPTAESGTDIIQQKILSKGARRGQEGGVVS
jgi:hypothetical protein